MSATAKTSTEAPASYELLSEAEKVHVWRLRSCMRITGCTLAQADRFANGEGDLHRLALLIEAHCPVRLALRIES